MPTDSAYRRTFDLLGVAAIVLSIHNAALASTQLIEHLKKGCKRRELKTTIALLASARGRDHQTILLIGERVIDTAEFVKSPQNTGSGLIGKVMVASFCMA